MIVNEISVDQKEQLIRVTPSSSSAMEYRPCQVTLKNGAILDHVYIQEKESYLKTWGVMPDVDRGKKYVLIEDVLEIRESPNRLPPELANKIYGAGESGMGYCLYKVILDNGQTIDILAGNAVDFVPLPIGMTFKNIIDVLPHQASRKNYVNGPDYYWCLFNGDIPRIYKDFRDYLEHTTANRSLPKSGRKWWQKLFGSE